MDYEKKYKEALEKAREIHSFSSDITEIKRMEQIFPELAESEDERIRKEIISALKYANHEGVYNKHLAWLEKQGEQKSVINMITPEESLGIDSDTYNDIVDECIYGEQNPIDKFEPKFKNGQWIVRQNKCYKVNCNGCGYELVDQNGLSTSLEYGTIDENAHLWTIQDAKDGDVLYSKKHNLIWIYKDNKHYYASLNLNYADVVSFDNEIVVPSNVCPANRVQKSILFQKIEEAGYEWDAEKKEVRKIEQNSAWSEEDEYHWMMCLECVEECATQEREDFLKTIDWLKSIKKMKEQ